MIQRVDFAYEKHKNGGSALVEYSFVMFFPWNSKKKNVKSDKRDLHICKSAPSDAG